MDILASLTPIFKPKSVAVIGASTAPGKLGHDILANLKNGGFPGALYPINPKADEILGLKVYKSIGDTPAVPDLAVVVIPARIVAATLEQCADKGVKAAIVITGGFAEAGPDGERLQDELAQVIRQTGMRVIGPNCQGVNMPHELMCASWPLITTRGRIAFASQSGTVGAAFLDMAAAEHLGVSGFVSLGNRVDVDEAEVLMYFNQDPHTQVIALYLEGVKRASYFLDALREAEKPVVILKAGRTLQGSRAAESHTKSMAGTDAIYDALFRKYRVHRADTLEELFDFAKALAYLPKPKGRKLMISTSSGGAAILAIDEAEKHGLLVPEPNPILKERLREMLPAHCAVGNPVDLTGDAISAPDLYKQVMDKTRAGVRHPGGNLRGPHPRGLPTGHPRRLGAGRLIWAGPRWSGKSARSFMRPASRSFPPRSGGLRPWPSSSGSNPGPPRPRAGPRWRSPRGSSCCRPRKPPP